MAHYLPPRSFLKKPEALRVINNYEQENNDFHQSVLFIGSNSKWAIKWKQTLCYYLLWEIEKTIKDGGTFNML